MNKNTIIGMLLLFALIMGMTWWNGKTANEREMARRELQAKRLAEQELEQKRIAEWNAMQDTLTDAQKDSLNHVAELQDSLNAVKHFGALVEASKGNEEIITLENEVIRVEINTHGGMIESATLKKYINNFDSTELKLFDKRNNDMAIVFEGRGQYRDDISTNELFFSTVQRNDSSVTLRLTSAEGGTLDFIYALSANSYVVDFAIRTENLDRLSHSNRFNLKWNQKMLRTEVGRDFEERNSSLS